MNGQKYSFQLGNIACTVLLDDASIIGKDKIVKRFPDATEAEYRQAYADIGLSLDKADNAFNILLAKIGEEIILVDTGEAGKPHGGYLLESMRLAGIDPNTITLVVLTHSHGDHVLGLLSDENEAVFPNARYVISKEEMIFWQDRIDDGMEDQRPIVAMMEEKGLCLIDTDEQIIQGMTAVPLRGHTPGQIALLLESENEKLLHLADLLHSPMQFAHPEWSAYFDNDTSISVPTRRETLKYAADENILTLFYHLTFPGLGRVKHAEKGFTWEALEI